MPALDELARRQLDAAPVLRAAGLSNALLDHADARVPLANAMAVWDAAAAHCGDRSFGMRAALGAKPGKFGVLEYLFSTSDTLVNGYTRMCSSVRIAYDHSDLRVSDTPSALSLVRTSRTGSAHYDEFIVCLLLLRGRLATGTKLAPRSASFRHGDLGARELRALLGRPIEHGARDLRLVLPARSARLALRGQDDGLNVELARYGALLLSAMRAPGPTLLADLRAEIVRQMPQRLPTLRSVATSLSLSARTLQRRLAGADASFAGELDAIRKELALRYIANPALSLAEIGFLLHYSNSPAFQRTFKRWTGTSPRAHRNALWC